MGPAVLDIPVMNPLRFVPVDGELPRDPRCNINHFDEGWFADYIRDWQTKTDYIQKWQQNDIVSFQLHANTVKGITLDIFDCTGRNWGTITQSSPLVTVTGVNAEIIPGTITTLNTYGKSLKLSILGLPDGIYWFYLTVAYDLDNDGTADYWRHNITEPMSIAAKQYGTTWLEWSHKTNKRSGDTIILFKQAPPRFSIRAEVDVVEYDFNSIDSQFEDEAYDASLLGSSIVRAAKFVTTQRLPEWMYEKLTEAWGCSTVKWEGRIFSKEINAKWEKNRLARLPKVHLTLAIRPDNRTKGRQVVATSIKVFTIPAYPFAITDTQLLNYTVNYTPGRYGVMHNLTELNTYITTLNTNVANLFLNGSYSIVSGDVIWTNGSGDDIWNATATIFTNPLTATITAAAALPIIFDYCAVIIDWGDGSNSFFQTAAASPISHSYGSSATRTISIYGVYNSVTLNDTNITAISGKLYAQCTKMVLFACGLTSFNCNVHSLAAAYLQNFTCVFSPLATITNLSTQGYLSLNFISLALNALSSTVANAVMADVYSIASSANIYLGQLYLNGQTPPAPLNPAGLMAKFQLQSSYNWYPVMND